MGYRQVENPTSEWQGPMGLERAVSVLTVFADIPVANGLSSRRYPCL
jgi:hypothetical protein